MYKATNAWGEEINAIHLLSANDYKLLALLDERQNIEKYVICKNYMMSGCDMGDLRHITRLMDATYYGVTDLDWAIYDLYKKK